MLAGQVMDGVDVVNHGHGRRSRCSRCRPVVGHSQGDSTFRTDIGAGEAGLAHESGGTGPQLSLLPLLTIGGGDRRGAVGTQAHGGVAGRRRSVRHCPVTVTVDGAGAGVAAHIGDGQRHVWWYPRLNSVPLVWLTGQAAEQLSVAVTLLFTSGRAVRCRCPRRCWLGFW